MDKNDFIKIINKLRDQYDYDIKKAKQLSDVYENAFSANLLYDNSILINSIIELLNIIIEDSKNMIEYFIYDLNFGRENDFSEIYIGNKKIKLNTIEDLWNVINIKDI